MRWADQDCSNECLLHCSRIFSIPRRVWSSRLVVNGVLSSQRRHRPWTILAAAACVRFRLHTQTGVDWHALLWRLLRVRKILAITNLQADVRACKKLLGKVRCSTAAAWNGRVCFAQLKMSEELISDLYRFAGFFRYSELYVLPVFSFIIWFWMTLVRVK